jgi:hypothetical protein
MTTATVEKPASIAPSAEEPTLYEAGENTWAEQFIIQTYRKHSALCISHPGGEHTMAFLHEQTAALAKALRMSGPEIVWQEALLVAALAMRVVMQGDPVYEAARTERKLGAYVAGEGFDPVDMGLPVDSYTVASRQVFFPATATWVAANVETWEKAKKAGHKVRTLYEKQVKE